MTLKTIDEQLAALREQAQTFYLQEAMRMGVRQEALSQYVEGKVVESLDKCIKRYQRSLNTSKYVPHQGVQEMARRAAQ